MQFVQLTESESFITKSEIFACKLGKIYNLTLKVKGLKGKSFSALVGIVSLDKKNQEIERKIEWLNDFSGTSKTINLFFRAPSDRAVVIYRINDETKVKSNCTFEITPIAQVSFSEVDPKDTSKFENIDSSSLPKNFSYQQAVKRWEEEGPNKGLTWGKILTGDAFINLAKKYDIFSSEKSILELGPGYGRNLKSILAKKIPFKFYTGVDISNENIEFLKKEFANKNIDFVKGDFANVVLDKKFDIVISSAVLKHQYPTFFKALKNIAQFVCKDGLFFFDLRENLNSFVERNRDDLLKLGPEKSVWEEGTETFVGFYTKSEVIIMLTELNQELITFDSVVHDKQIGERLVVFSKIK